LPVNLLNIFGCSENLAFLEKNSVKGFRWLLNKLFREMMVCDKIVIYSWNFNNNWFMGKTAMALYIMQFET